MGFYSPNKWGKYPVWGKFSAPDQFVDQGKKTEYDLDLKKWAPGELGWEGMVQRQFAKLRAEYDAQGNSGVSRRPGSTGNGSTPDRGAAPHSKDLGSASQSAVYCLEHQRSSHSCQQCIFNEESLLFPKWGDQSYHGVPFMVLDPENGKTKNTICLYSGLGAISSRMPQTVRLSCDSPATTLHFLGAAGWGLPWTKQRTTSMVVRLEYADGGQEDHPLLNGVHLTDWAKGPDVPESKNIGVLQVRYFSIVPKRQDESIRVMEFRKGKDQTSPFVIAVTIETPVTQKRSRSEGRVGEASEDGRRA